MTISKQPIRQGPAGTGHTPFHRSGAVAHMLRMPVATLRVWERRYGLTRPALSPSGRRLYSADDVRHLALVKQLTDLGHAIGSLAHLDMSQLQRVAATHADALAATQGSKQAESARPPPARAWRLAVIGATLGKRLQHPAMLRRLGRPLSLLGPFDDVAQAAAALQPSNVDALLVYEPQLQAGWPASFNAAAPSLTAVPKALLYGFAADAVCDTLAAAGMALLRGPQPDAVLAQWLHAFSMATTTPQPVADNAAQARQPAPPRRWDDAALADFAARSSAIACECPRHVAELLMQLSHFEAYSAGCEQRNAADAEIHTHLKQVAAASRTRFEDALEHVALHEGLLLPASSGAAHARRPRPRRSAAPRSRP